MLCCATGYKAAIQSEGGLISKPWRAVQTEGGKNPPRPNWTSDARTAVRPQVGKMFTKNTFSYLEMTLLFFSVFAMALSYCQHRTVFVRWRVQLFVITCKQQQLKNSSSLYHRYKILLSQIKVTKSLIHLALQIPCTSSASPHLANTTASTVCVERVPLFARAARPFSNPTN